MPVCAKYIHSQQGDAQSGGGNFNWKRQEGCSEREVAILIGKDKKAVQRERWQFCLD
jgi:hypothetical protein